jgi:hypothetical protein
VESLEGPVLGSGCGEGLLLPTTRQKVLAPHVK